jgi:hypothetical protein
MRPGLYKHYKGKMYLVFGVAHNSNNAAEGFQGVPDEGAGREAIASISLLTAPQVVYLPLYGTTKPGQITKTGLCVRSLPEFCELVTISVPDGNGLYGDKRVPRFEFVAELGSLVL